MVQKVFAALMFQIKFQAPLLVDAQADRFPRVLSFGKSVTRMVTVLTGT